jgi:hypothetical protein
VSPPGGRPPLEVRMGRLLELVEQRGPDAAVREWLAEATAGELQMLASPYALTLARRLVESNNADHGGGAS